MTLDIQQLFNKRQVSFGPNLTVTICYKAAEALNYMLWQFTCSSEFNSETASVKPSIFSWQLIRMWGAHRLWHSPGCWHTNKVCVICNAKTKGERFKGHLLFIWHCNQRDLSQTATYAHSQCERTLRRRILVFEKGIALLQQPDIIFCYARWIIRQPLD